MSMWWVILVLHPLDGDVDLEDAVPVSRLDAVDDLVVDGDRLANPARPGVLAVAHIVGRADVEGAVVEPEVDLLVLEAREVGEDDVALVGRIDAQVGVEVVLETVLDLAIEERAVAPGRRVPGPVTVTVALHGPSHLIERPLNLVEHVEGGSP